MENWNMPQNFCFAFYLNLIKSAAQTAAYIFTAQMILPCEFNWNENYQLTIIHTAEDRSQKVLMCCVFLNVVSNKHQMPFINYIEFASLSVERFLLEMWVCVCVTLWNDNFQQVNTTYTDNS